MIKMNFLLQNRNRLVDLKKKKKPYDNQRENIGNG